MSGFGIEAILDYAARVRLCGRPPPDPPWRVLVGPDITRNVTVRGFGTLDWGHFCAESGDYRVCGENNREKMRNEGEAFQERKADTGCNGRFLPL